MRQRRIRLPLASRTLVVLFSLVLASEETVARCEKAAITEWPPTQEAWCSAMGEKTRIRFRRSHGEWTLARSATWSPDALLVRGPHAEPESAFLVLPYYALAETLRVAWNEIDRADRHQGNRAAQGVIIGGLAWLVVIGIYAAGDGESPYFCAVSGPVSIALGGIAGALLPRWVPIYCNRPGQVRE